MNRLWIFLVLVLFTGCDLDSDNNFKKGSCTVVKVDGKVTHVKVTLPRHRFQGNDEFDVKDRTEMDSLIEFLESSVLDLKEARDQMPIVEIVNGQEK